MNRIEGGPLLGREGKPVSAREYVRELTKRYGPIDEAVLDELTIQWRAEVNRNLRGTNAGVVGDQIVVSVEHQDLETIPPQGPGSRHEIEDVVYGVEMAPGTVHRAQVMHQRPELSVVHGTGVK